LIFVCYGLKFSSELIWYRGHSAFFFFNLSFEKQYYLLFFLILFLPESVRFMLVRNYPATRIASTLATVCKTEFAPGATFFAPEPPVHTKKPIGVLFL
jgi:hypothetical protein